jgi:hypothetical protein
MPFPVLENLVFCNMAPFMLMNHDVSEASSAFIVRVCLRSSRQLVPYKCRCYQTRRCQASLLLHHWICCSDTLRAGPSGDRIPMKARFSAPVQSDPEAHPASCTMGTGSFPGVKTAGAWRWPPTPSSAEVKERAELYLCSPFEPSWPVLGWTSPLPYNIYFSIMTTAWIITCNFNRNLYLTVICARWLNRTSHVTGK